MLQSRPVSGNGLQGGLADGQLAFLFAFAVNAHQALGGVQIHNAQAAQFADAQAAGIDHLQHGGVTQVWCGIDSIRLLGFLAGAGQFVQGRFQQSERLFGREKLGQPFFFLGQYNLFHRRGIEFAAAHEVFVKGSQC